MRYRFHILDVFTDRRFAGNQLAVLPDAAGLDAEQMQAIAAEFGFSETVFVQPPTVPDAAARLRIFTPGAELPFAGHPTVGAALLLARQGLVAIEGDRLVLEEGAGRVPVVFSREGGTIAKAAFSAPALPVKGAAIDPASAATAIGLAVQELVTGDLPVIAGCGLDFAIIEVINRASLVRARSPAVMPPDIAAHDCGLFVFARVSGDSGRIEARMFAPNHGIAEDAATGSAAAAFAGLMGLLSDVDDGELHWEIEQGARIGRPSLISASVRLAGGAVEEVRVGGKAVEVAEGWLEA